MFRCRRSIQLLMALLFAEATLDGPGDPHHGNNSNDKSVRNNVNRSQVS